MVFILAPIAIAGYMHYKKQQAEREAHERKVAEQGECDDKTGEGAVPVVTDCSEEGSSLQTNEPLGPVGKFILFCENLEKEIQKAQERKRREAEEQAWAETQAGLAMNRKDSVLTTTDASEDSSDGGDYNINDEIKTWRSKSMIVTTKRVGVPKSNSVPNLHLLFASVSRDNHTPRRRSSMSPKICW